VAGGINVPEVLGSRSTALRGGFGGVEGVRWRQEIDYPGPATYKPLPEGGVGIEPPELALRDVFAAPVKGIVPVRAIPSGEYALFAADHRVSGSNPGRFPASNRTGYRLAGEPIFPSRTVEMRSYGLIPGIVQVPPAGSRSYS
jgi:allophanate hydrolase subunit 2